MKKEGSLLFSWIAFGCAPTGVAPRPTEPCPTERSADVSRAMDARGSVTVSASPAFASEVVFVAPAEGASVPVEGARALPIEIELPDAPPSAPGAHVVLVLHGHGIRDLAARERKIVLGDLVNEDEELAPGPYLLAAVLCRLDGTVIRDPRGRGSMALRTIFVGPPSPLPPGPPIIVPILPRATVNGGAEADDLVLDFVLAAGGARESPVSLRVQGPRGESSARLAGPGPFRLGGLESGDYRFTLEASPESPGPGGWGRVSRAVTVNRDLPP